MRAASMRVRLTVWLTLALALVMVSASYFLLSYTQRMAESYAEEVLRSAGQRLVLDAGNEGAGNDVRRFVEEEQKELSNEQLVLTADGLKSRVPLAANELWRVQVVETAGHTFRLGLPWQQSRQLLAQQCRQLALLSLCGLLAASVGSWWLVGQALSPIARLSQQARVASGRELLATPSADAEMVELVATLNGLLQRLSDTVALQGRFYAAASHELRTPLQALSGHLGLGLSRPRSQEEYLTILQEAHGQSQRLKTLVRDLLLLSQLEFTDQPEAEEVSLSKVTERILGQLQGDIEERQIRVSQTGLDWTLLAPPNHVEMLLRNLLANSVRYTSAGCRVEVHLSRPEWSVFNPCVLSPEENLQTWFEPFYRPPGSLTEGTGLGLTICLAIARVNGWQLTLQRVKGGVLALVNLC